MALSFRNGPIEQIHASPLCPTCGERGDYSHITDAEMKAIMKAAVNRVYQLLVLKEERPAEYDRQVRFGEGYTQRWDEPEEPASWADPACWGPEPPL